MYWCRVKVLFFQIILDIDECKTGQHDCQNQCVNTQGSYQCTCQTGFNQIGGQCLGK